MRLRVRDFAESVRLEVSLLVEERSVDYLDPKQPCELHLVDLDYVIRHPSDAHEIEVIRSTSPFFRALNNLWRNRDFALLFRVKKSETRSPNVRLRSGHGIGRKSSSRGWKMSDRSEQANRKSRASFGWSEWTAREWQLRVLRAALRRREIIPDLACPLFAVSPAFIFVDSS
jgi:hypothetical protein